MNVLPYITDRDIKFKNYLTKIYGIKYSRAIILCKELGLSPIFNYIDIKIEDKRKLEDLILLKYKYLIESDLKKFNHDNIKTKKHIRNYKGIRHSLSLPVNGQNTKTNAKTRKHGY